MTTSFLSLSDRHGLLILRQTIKWSYTALINKIQ